jgi:hypothetical protein
MVGGDGLWNGPLRMLWREGTPMVSEDCLQGGREGASERGREGGSEEGLDDCGMCGGLSTSV